MKYNPSVLARCPIGKWIACLVCCLGLAACGKGKPREAAAASAPEADIATAVASNPVEAVPTSLLEKLITPKMLGVDVAYFQQFSGIPKMTQDEVLLYDVEGCTIGVYTDVKASNPDRRTVDGLMLEVNERCTVDVNSFFNGWNNVQLPPANRMTVGDLENMTGETAEYAADCLYMCGNSYEPRAYVFWEAPHALNNFRTHVTLVEEQDAMSQWADQLIAKKGEQWVIDASFNCDRRASSAMARPFFKNVRIASISLGAYPKWIDSCR